MTYIPIPNPLPIDGTVINTPNNDLLDAFSRGRVSEPTSLFYSSFQWDLQPLLWDTDLTGAATVVHAPNESSAELTVTTASGDIAVMATREYFRYQPGKSQLIFMTFVMPAAAANQDCRVGQFTDENGIFLERSGTTVAFVRRSYTTGSAVDETVAQASWNLDVMDGTGDSGVTLDLTKAQILVMDYQWLGYGRVRMGFDVDGLITWCHQFVHANVLTTPWATTANLPLRAEIENTAASTAGNMQLTCCAVSSEGGTSLEPGIPVSASNEVTSVTGASGTDTAILAIRVAATFNSIATNGIKIELDSVSSYNTSSPALIKVWYNPTVTAGSWAAVNGSSAMEKNVTATGFSGGIPIAQYYTITAGTGGNARAEGAASLASKLPFGLDYSGTPITLLVTAAGIGGTAPTYAVLKWLEVR